MKMVTLFVTRMKQRLRQFKKRNQKKIQKIILELTGKLKSLGQRKAKSPEDKEAMDALLALGFSRSKAREALSHLPANLSSSEEKVREALKAMRAA